MTHRKTSISYHHWRLVLAGLAGLAAFASVRFAAAPVGYCALVGWDTAAILFLVTTGWFLFRDDGATVQARAANRDETAGVITTLVLAAVAASVAATVVALGEAKSRTLGPHPWPLALSVATLVLSWLVIQVVFTLRYAHLYFGDSDADGAINGGVEFPGDPPKDYRDFIYMAVCVGCTSQVSDFNITTSRFRTLVTTHALLSFSFNVAVVALGINMVATILGQ